jgi:hypothetical protein
MPWVRVCKRGDEGEATTSTHVIDWCRGLTRAHDEAWNTACAVALASLDWPAATLLLEERWRVDGQEAALQGLLCAAARGRVSPVLSHPDTLRTLLARPLDGPAGGPAAEALARGLAQISPFAANGDALAPILVEGWEGASLRSRWVRLVALEGMGVRHPGAARCAREVFVDPAAGAHLRRQAARALARTRDVKEQVVLSARGLSDLFGASQAVATLPADLSAAGALPPATDLRVWDLLPVNQDTRLAFVEWCLGAGSADADAAAATCLGEILESPAARLGSIVEHLRQWGAGTLRGPTKQVLNTVREGRSSTAVVDEVAFRAGLLGATERRAYFDAQLALRAHDSLDPVLLRRIACAAADPGLGAGARDVLLAALADGAPVEALLPAIELANEVLLRARLDEERTEFLARLRREASRGRHPILERFFARDWPPRAVLRPLRLDSLDRSIGAQ